MRLLCIADKGFHSKGCPANEKSGDHPAGRSLRGKSLMPAPAKPPGGAACTRCQRPSPLGVRTDIGRCARSPRYSAALSLRPRARRSRARLCLRGREHSYAYSVFDALILSRDPCGSGLRVFPGPSPGRPAGPYGALVRQGFRSVQDTPRTAGPYTRARVSCADCHLAGGTRAYAAPLDVYGLFPSYQKRWKTVETLSERVQDC